MSCFKVLLRGCRNVKTVTTVLIDDVTEKEPLLNDDSGTTNRADYRTTLTKDYLDALPQDEPTPCITRIPHFPVWLVLAIFHDTTYRREHAYIKSLYDLGCDEEPYRWQEPLAHRKYRHIARALSAIPNWQQDEILHAPWYKLFWLDCTEASIAFYEEISRISHVTQGFTACRTDDIANHLKYRGHQLKRKLKASER